LLLCIKKTTGDPVPPGVKDIGYADILMIAFYFFDGAGKDPWMPPQYGSLATLFQTDPLHGWGETIGIRQLASGNRRKNMSLFLPNA
jgi:hypothetical protein